MAVSASSVVTKDLAWNTAGAATWSDETWRDQTYYLHTVKEADTLGVAEAIKKTATARAAESFRLVDGAPVKEMEKDNAEALRLAEVRGVSMTHPLTEALRLVETPDKEVGRPVTETFGVSDGGQVVKEATKDNVEPLRVSDARTISMWQALREVLAVLETPAKEVGRPVAETFGIVGGKVANKPMVNAVQTLGVAEDYARTITAKRAEALLIEDDTAADYTARKAEIFALAEAVARKVTKNNVEEIALLEVFSRVAKFTRQFAETVAVQDSLAKLYKKAESQSLKLASEMVVPAAMIIGDMLMERLGTSNDLSFDDFLMSLDAGAVPGWTPWRTFLPGDYDYTKAMFRVVMDSISADRGSVEVCQVAVDVPDVNDHGSARVLDASAGVYVEFAREYHIIPEITITAKGGTGSPTAAELTGTPTLLGFTARLRDTMTGNYVTGTFTWVANGY